MIGNKYSRLYVAGQHGVRNNKRTWKCICDCGKTVIAATGSLRSGNTRSCGCLKLGLLTKHGMHRSRTYRIWRAMLNRCSLGQYRKYYAHVQVCDRWHKFTNFLTDMGEAPEGLTLDRINNSLGYSPDNCRWTTRTQQARNTRRRKEYEHKGERRSLIEWSEKLGVNHDLVRGRIRRGWEFADAIAGL